MSVLSSLLGSKGGERGLDEETKMLFDEFISENSQRKETYHPLIYSGAAGKKLLALPVEERVELIIYLMNKSPEAYDLHGKRSMEASSLAYAYTDLPVRLLRKKTETSVESLLRMLDIVKDRAKTDIYSLPVSGILRIAERMAENGPLDPRLTESFKKIRRHTRDWGYSELRKLKDRVHRLAAGDIAPIFDGNEAWVRRITEVAGKLNAKTAKSWSSVLTHASTANSARPSKTWLKKATPLLDELGQEQFAELAGQCFAFILDVNFKERPMATDVNSNTVRGLVWISSLFDNEKLLTKVHDLGAYSFRKVPNYGAGCSKVGNAAVYTLGAQPGIAAISWLTALKGQVKYRQAQRLIEKALTSAADERGVSVDTLEELAVPTFGLDASGQLKVPIGDFTAIVRIGQGGKTTLTWAREDGKEQKSVPKAVKESSPAELKAIRSTARDISKTWLAQRNRVERQFLEPAQWTLPDWRERYLNHPLMQHIAGKLIFEFSEQDNKTLACWFDGALRDADGNAVEFSDAAEVTLWHPIGHDASVVLAWRRFLENNEITQPLKQAHREVYIVTDAERETNVYSNRFAGHILRQHQLAALCRDRGWNYDLQGAFDSHNAPTKHFLEIGLTVQYYCDAIGDAEVSDMGIYNYVSTDQVRFTQDLHEPVSIATIPERLFSEIMRDVDLFVGVASIGNDPNWVDGGGGAYGDYWQDYAFGKLSASAEIRRDLLERIVPKLKIADRLSVDGRFLIVKGDMRTYRIHLGSGNIQMEPNYQYLCIVQGNEARRGRDAVMLPFEGDGLLSIILSKAALLAADTRIKDPTILSQIRAG